MNTQPTPPPCPQCGRTTDVQLMTRTAGRTKDIEIWRCRACEQFIVPTLPEGGGRAAMKKSPPAPPSPQTEVVITLHAHTTFDDEQRTRVCMFCRRPDEMCLAVPCTRRATLQQQR